MEVTETDLENIREICLDYYSSEKPDIRTIVLYGGAAKNFVGQGHTPGDFDLNMFFDRSSSVKPTQARPKILGQYQGLKVEVMRNTVPEDMSIEEYVSHQDSKRWDRIRDETVVQIYPAIRHVDWDK